MDWPFVSEFFHLACFFFQDSSMYLIAFNSWIILCCMDIPHLICLCIAWRAIWVVSTFWLIWIILLWLEKEMATHSSILAWRIPWTGEPGGLLSMGSHRIGHDWSDLACMHACIGEGNGNPLQYSCLENPRDRGAWWAAIYGVTQSQTQLTQLSSSSYEYLSVFMLLCGHMFSALLDIYLGFKFFLSNLYSLIPFPWFTDLVRTSCFQAVVSDSWWSQRRRNSRIMQTRSDEGRNPCLVPDIAGKTFSFSPLSVILLLLLLSRFSRVRLLVTPWTAAYQAPPSMGFSRRGYWSGVPVPFLSVILVVAFFVGNLHPLRKFHSVPSCCVFILNRC